MNSILQPYCEGFKRTGNVLEDVTAFFTLHQDTRTLDHTLQVAREAQRIAELYDTSKIDTAVQAALLHDISNVIPISNMLQSAEELSIEILDDERKYARSVHQKLSKVLAEEIFEVTNPAILSAIESHTTHKPDASMVDKILFVADKISWNLPGDHEYLLVMREKVNALEMDQAILIYLDSLWEQREKLKLVHPWLIRAREQLMVKVRSGY